MNFLKHSKVKAAHQAHSLYVNREPAPDTDQVTLKELQKEIDAAINDLPEQCRTIFQLSRFEDLKYKDIAGKLGISVKTVENQMGKALRTLRTKLAGYLPLLLMIVNVLNLTS